MSSLEQNQSPSGKESLGSIYDMHALGDKRELALNKSHDAL